MSKFQQLCTRLPFAVSQVLFSRHWLWPSPCCQLTCARNHLSRCENDTRRPHSGSRLHHHEADVKNTDWIQTMPVCTQFCDLIWDAKWGFHLVETGLQLQAGSRSFPPSPFHSMESHPPVTEFYVGGRGKYVQITRLDCTHWAIQKHSWSGKPTFGGGQPCRAELDGEGRALRNYSRY